MSAVPIAATPSTVAGDPVDHFPASYRASRERALVAAHALSSRHDVRVDSRAIGERGPDGETLALDWIQFGARRPKRALVVSSGTHGVEGFTGAAIQHWMLQAWLPDVRLDDHTAVIVQHANNPYGFAWLRRVNESNVDINRNFVERFDTALCSPDYERLYDALNPPDLDPAHESERLARIDAFVAEHGMRRFQTAVSEGQYKFPRGLQYGGQRREAGVAHLLALVREHLAAAELVIWLDVHTGLGASGACELITGAPVDSDSYRDSQEMFDGRVRSADSGESVSPPLRGLMDRGVARVLPPGCRFAVASPEYGTHDMARVLMAMRADNWLHHHGDPLDALGRRIKVELMEVFRPASPEWMRTVLPHGARLVAQAAAHLPGARSASAPRR